MRPPIRQIFEEPQGSSSIDDKINKEVKPVLAFPYINKKHHLTRGLVGAYPFRLSDGTKLLDSTDNKNDGVSITPIWTGGQFGHSLEFNGSSDRVEILDHPLLNFAGKSSGSMSVWANTNASQNNKFIMALPDIAGVDNGSFEIRQVSNDWGFNVITSAGNSLMLGGTSTIGKWKHLVVTYDGITARGYEDGILVVSEPRSLGTGLLHASGDLFFGGHGNNFNWNGLITEGRVYNRALSTEEVNELFYAPWDIYKRPTIYEKGLLGANITAVTTKNYYVGDFASGQRLTRGLAGVR